MMHNPKPKITVRDHPVLQDIDWDIADILVHNSFETIEEVVFLFTDNIPSDRIKECRAKLFQVTKGLL